MCTASPFNYEKLRRILYEASTIIGSVPQVEGRWNCDVTTSVTETGVSLASSSREIVQLVQTIREYNTTLCLRNSLFCYAALTDGRQSTHVRPTKRKRTFSMSAAEDDDVILEQTNQQRHWPSNPDRFVTEKEVYLSTQPTFSDLRSTSLPLTFPPAFPIAWSHPCFSNDPSLSDVKLSPYQCHTPFNSSSPMLQTQWQAAAAFAALCQIQQPVASTFHGSKTVFYPTAALSSTGDVWEQRHHTTERTASTRPGTIARSGSNCWRPGGDSVPY